MCVVVVGARVVPVVRAVVVVVVGGAAVVTVVDVVVDVVVGPTVLVVVVVGGCVVEVVVDVGRVVVVVMVCVVVVVLVVVAVVGASVVVHGLSTGVPACSGIDKHWPGRTALFGSPQKMALSWQPFTEHQTQFACVQSTHSVRGLQLEQPKPMGVLMVHEVFMHT